MGKTIGAVTLDENQRFAEFEYDGSFIKSGIQISPIMMPLKSGVYKFTELDYGTFHGLIIQTDFGQVAIRCV